MPPIVISPLICVLLELKSYSVFSTNDRISSAPFSEYNSIFSANSVEAKFVNELEVSSAVDVYAKLPRRFKIPTPVGNYAPDWVIAFKKGTAKHIFFVAETKGSLSSMDIREMENAKIACAEILFNEVNQADVIYHKASTYQDLFDFVTKD